MRQRCNNPNHIDYPSYGGRGITICDEWDKFEQFYADMGDKPEGMSLDREDNDKGYSKKNCRWATPKQQRSNQRNADRKLYVVIEGEKVWVIEYAARFGIRDKAAMKRFHKKQFPFNVL